MHDICIKMSAAPDEVRGANIGGYMTKEMTKSTAHKLTAGQKVYRFIKAVMDFFAALLALILFSPLFIIVAIAIKLDSPGPVFFVQKRIGKNGKLFNCIKFRSMSTEARPDVAGYEYAEVTSYVTKVGKFIRKFSIDELPQIFNILAFQMSWVGYRPSQACEEELNTPREEYGMYQLVPGISGWAQVNGRDVLAAQPKKKAEFDAYYLHNFSFWLDVKIFFMTIAKVFGHSDVVEGVIEQQPEEVTAEEILVSEAASEQAAEIELAEVTAVDGDSPAAENEEKEEVTV